MRLKRYQAWKGLGTLPVLALLLGAGAMTPQLAIGGALIVGSTLLAARAG